METLAAIAGRTGTDKLTLHTYLPVYEELLGPRRGEALDLLEIGILCGQSLRMWLEYLPRAFVHGLDCGLNAEARALECDRLRLHEARQEDRAYLASHFPPDSLDVVIDDGSHRLHDQLASCFGLWPALRPGGLYVIEDVLDQTGLEALCGAFGRHLLRVHRSALPYDTMVVLKK